MDITYRPAFDMESQALVVSRCAGVHQSYARHLNPLQKPDTRTKGSEKHSVSSCLCNMLDHNHTTCTTSRSSSPHCEMQTNAWAAPLSPQFNAAPIQLLCRPGSTATSGRHLVQPTSTALGPIVISRGPWLGRKRCRSAARGKEPEQCRSCRLACEPCFARLLGLNDSLGGLFLCSSLVFACWHHLHHPTKELRVLCARALQPHDESTTHPSTSLPPC